LLDKAPESVYAKIILDPTYLDRLAQQRGETEQMYEQTYNHFRSGEYQSVIKLASDAIERFPKDALTPKFAYLRAISTGKLAGTDEAMRNEMRTITTEYPRTDIAAEAQNLIDFIDNKDPEMKQAEQAERAKALYTSDKTGAYYFVWMVDVKENINQLSFDIQLFNTDDRYINDQLAVERNNIDQRHVLLMVKRFENYPRAQVYYRAFVMNTEVTKNAMYQHTPFLISEGNYVILSEDKKVEDYVEFFKKEYLKQ